MLGEYITIPKTVFFGCGNLGHEMLDLWKRFHVTPEYFCDNNSKLWDTYIEGIKVIQPREIVANSLQVFITIAYTGEVHEQLISFGIYEDNIKETAYPLYVENLKMIADAIACHPKDNGCVFNDLVYFDLNCGMVLGGVEQWSYKTGDYLCGVGKNIKYIVPFIEPVYEYNGSEKNIITIGNSNEIDAKVSVFMDAMDLFSTGGMTVICNFPFEIFQAAVFAKKKSNSCLKIIAVVHCDEELYYRVYGRWQEYVDCFVVISKRIGERLKNYGIADERIRYLTWDIAFPKRIKTYSSVSEPIRIGYAGRITIRQKRTDLFKDIIMGLRNKNINFQFEIAGDGDYRDELEDWLKSNGIEDVVCLGSIIHDKIYDFWNDKDVYLSVSEWEGHSISQVEAMAMGVVPIVTDVSGAEDDITDGSNGFIVNVGDVDSIVERIEILSKDRMLLKRMGEKAKESIVTKSSCNSELKLWKELMPDV